ncbi:hypothetical protein ACDT12_13180, partial [Staphylococcus aureus]
HEFDDVLMVQLPQTLHLTNSRDGKPVLLVLHSNFLQRHDLSYYSVERSIKPVYNNITEHAPNEPVIVFVPSRKLTMTTAYELMALCAANLQETKFLHAPIADIQLYIDRLSDNVLKETVSKAIGYLTEGLCEDDRHLIQVLFNGRAIQVLIVSKSLAWSLESFCKLVIIMDTQSYNGKIHTYEDYPITDMLHMLGRANRNGIDKSSKAVILCQTHKKNIYKKFLTSPLPVESHLDRS